MAMKTSQNTTSPNVSQTSQAISTQGASNRLQNLSREMDDCEACELFEVKKLLDEISKEKAKFESDAKRLCEENKDLKKNLDKKTKELIISQRKFSVHEVRVAKYNQYLEKENDELRLELDSMRKHLDHEVRSQMYLQRRVLSMREELTLKEEIIQRERTGTRTRYPPINVRLCRRQTEHYVAELEQSVRELREKYEEEKRLNWDIHHREVKLNHMEHMLEADRKRHSDDVEWLETERLEHAEEITELESELNFLREEMANQQHNLNNGPAPPPVFGMGRRYLLTRVNESTSRLLTSLTELPARAPQPPRGP